MENLEVIISLASTALGLLISAITFLAKFIKNAIDPAAKIAAPTKKGRRVYIYLTLSIFTLISKSAEVRRVSFHSAYFLGEER